MLDEKNKSISFLWELNSILMIDVNSNMAALSRGFKPRKAKLAKANSEVLVYTPKQKINLKPLRRNLLNCA